MAEVIREVNLYSDGACSPNPGAGAYGVVLECEVNGTLYRKTYSQGYKNTTNNRMELLGVIKGLESLNKPCIVNVISDSSYVVNAINKRWINSWKSKNWVKNGEPVKNTDLWKRLWDLIQFHHKVTFTWVRGHDGHPQNEECDRLAVAARLDYTSLITDTGFTGK